MTYKEKLLSPLWQKKRLEILSRDKFTCTYCYNSDKTLHVHHLAYQFKKDPWDYDNSHLVTLCVDCHTNATAFDKVANDIIINKILVGLKGNFIKDCALEVFSKYNINDLVYELWEDLHGDNKYSSLLNEAPEHLPKTSTI